MLSGQRSFTDAGMSLPILVSDIYSYVRMFGVPETLDRFVNCIVSMDKEYVLLATARISTKAEAIG